MAYDSLPRLTVLGQRSGWLLLRNFARHGVQVLVIMYLGRKLPPASFGVMALIMVATVFATALIDLGMGDAIVRWHELTNKDKQSIFWLCLGSGAFCGAILFILSDPIGAYFAIPDLALMLKLMSWHWLMVGLGVVPLGLMIRDSKFKALAVQSIIAASISAFVAVFWVKNYGGTITLVIQAITLQTLISILSFWKIQFPIGKPSLLQIKTLMQFSGPLIGVRFLDFVNRKLDDLIIGVFLGTHVLGFYSMAYQLVLALETLLIQGMDSLSLRAIAEAPSKEDRQATYLFLTQISAWLSLPAFIGLALVAPDWFYQVLDPIWIPAGEIARILCFACLLHALLHVNTSALKAKGKTGLYFMFSAGNTIVNLAIYFVTVHFGAFAVAFGYTIRSYLIDTHLLRMGLRLLRLKFSAWLEVMRAPLLATLLMALLVFLTILIMPPSPERFIASVAVGIIVYSPICLLYWKKLAMYILSRIQAKLIG